METRGSGRSNSDEASKPAGFGRVLGNRAFFALWLAQFISSFGDWLAILALFSLVAFRWKGSPDAVAGLFIAFILPWALLGPLAGVFVDRWNLKRTLIASDLVRAALVALLPFARELPQVYAVFAAVSVVSSFFVPAQGAAIPRLVARDELLVANSLNAQTVQLNKVVSPAVAGALVAWAGEGLCFWLDSLSFVISAALLARLPSLPRAAAATLETAAADPPGPPAAASAQGVRAVLRELREGVVYVHRHRVLRFVTLAVTAAIFMVGAIDSLISIFVRDTLHAGSRAFGALVAAVGVGTVVGAALLGRFAQRLPRLYLVVWGIAGMGLGLVFFALAGAASTAMAWSFALGLAVAAVLVPAQTLVQEETPPPLLGRVSSATLSLATVAQLVGVAIAGRLATWLGIRRLYQLLGVALVLLGASGYGWARTRRLTAPRTD